MSLEREYISLKQRLAREKKALARFEAAEIVEDGTNPFSIEKRLQTKKNARETCKENIKEYEEILKEIKEDLIIFINNGGDVSEKTKEEIGYGGDVMNKINIQISRDTHSLLKELGKKGESYEQILLQYLPVRADLTATIDSYTTNYPLVAIDEIINFIKTQRVKSEYNYNLYSGGVTDSTMATIKCYRQGYSYKNCIKLQFTSEAQCRAFEKRIKPLFKEEDFSPRK